MAKEREHRYASTSDVLMDLLSVAAGEPPPLARKHINVDVLSSLTGQAEIAPQPKEVEVSESAKDSNLVAYLILLGAALAVSIIMNIVQFILSVKR